MSSSYQLDHFNAQKYQYTVKLWAFFKHISQMFVTDIKATGFDVSDISIQNVVARHFCHCGVFKM